MDIQNNNPTQNTAPQVPPKTWLVESILATLLCCLPFGIVGIINASKVESRFYAGDIEAAERYSREAAKWTKLSFFLGLAVIIIYVLLMLFGVVGSLAALGSY